MPASPPDLAHIRGVLLDMDGVVYVGDTPLPGVQELLDYLDATGRGWLFVTNNASKRPDQFVEKLAGMGIRARPERILTSAMATARWLAAHYPDRGPVFMVGMEGLRWALEEAGFTLVEDPFQARFVVCGIDFQVCYPRLADATLAIRNGALFVGTNGDRSFPTERGLVPGTGSLLALLQAASDVTPTVIGKPNPGMFEEAMRILGTDVETTLMVGDRYETDILGAARLGMPTVAVLTGIHDRATFEQADPPPTWILPDLPALLAAFQAADARASG